MSVSEEFEEAFATGVSACRGTCDCGITHFDTYNSWDWDEGEFERLSEHSKTDPRHYIPTSHAVSWMKVAGMMLIMGCPCNQAARYESWILAHAEAIAKFLNARSARLKLEAEAMKVNDVPQAG